MKKRVYSRNGITVAEVVIALVIIAVISACTLSLIVMSIGVETKSESAIEVKNAAENAIECFRFARDNAGEVFHEQGFLFPDFKYTLSTLFFACLKKSNQNYTHEILSDEIHKSSPTVQDGVWIRDDILPDCVFTLVVDGCTITIEQIKDGGSNVVGFSFVAMRGEEELESFTFPEAVEQND